MTRSPHILRVAELSRWRQIAQSGVLGVCLKRGWMFVVAEQSIVYHRPILPFQAFVVRSTISHEGKWIYYDHYFESCPGDDKSTHAARPVTAGAGAPGSSAPTMPMPPRVVLYAHNRVRAVAKERSGKTVPPTAIVDACPDLEAWLEGHNGGGGAAK